LTVYRSAGRRLLPLLRQALRNSSALSTEKFNAAGDTRVSRWSSQSSSVVAYVGMACGGVLGVWE